MTWWIVLLLAVIVVGWVLLFAACVVSGRCEEADLEYRQWDGDC